MSADHKVTDDSPSSPAMTYDEARIDHLIRFAALTPEQKIKFLGDMLEFIESARKAGHEVDKNPAM